jgi:hypothetical protein
MSDPLLPLLKEDTTSSITIYFSKSSPTTTDKTKKILELENINIQKKY